MLRFSSFAGSLSAVMLMTSTALAQVPPDPANPNEAVPEKAT